MYNVQKMTSEYRENSSAKQHVVCIWQVEENGPRHAGQENISLGVQRYTVDFPSVSTKPAKETWGINKTPHGLCHW